MEYLYVFRVPRILTLEDVKPIIGNLSRDNYYELRFGGLSPDLLAYVGARGVDQQFIAGSFGLMAYEAQIPGTSLADLQSNNYLGVTENFAHRKIFSDFSVSFYCDDEYKGLKFLEHWMEYTVSGNGTGRVTDNYADPNYSYRLRYPTEYKSGSTTILKFERNVERVLSYSFLGLFPKALNAVPLSYGTKGGGLNGITKINCTFKYDRFIAGSVYSYDSVRGLGNNLDATVRNLSNAGAAAVGNLTSAALNSLVNTITNR